MEWIRGKSGVFGRLVAALTAAFLTTIVLLLIFAFLLLKLQPDAGKTAIGILLIYVLSGFIGGWYCGRKSDSRKFLWGMLTGVLYFLLLLVISGMGEEAFAPGLVRTGSALLLCAGGGMLGGMLSP